MPACLLLATLVVVVGRSAVQAADDPGEIAESVTRRSAFVQKPRWEFGIGGGFFQGHDYPASDDPNSRALVLPFFIYRSAVFRVGGGGVRAVAIEKPRLQLDISVGASLSARSEGNGIRADMPELDFLLEAGPKLTVSLIDRPVPSGGRFQIDAAVELRAVAATDFRGIAAQGFKAEIDFDVARRRVFGSGIDLLAGFDLTFADERLQDYFYEVESRFATANREAFDAGGGYLGSKLSLGAALRPRPGLRVFLAVQSGLYAGAANADSPLFETTTNTGVAIGFAWTLLRSDAVIDVVEVD